MIERCEPGPVRRAAEGLIALAKQRQRATNGRLEFERLDRPGGRVEPLIPVALHLSLADGEQDASREVGAEEGECGEQNLITVRGGVEECDDLRCGPVASPPAVGDWRGRERDAEGVSRHRQDRSHFGRQRCAMKQVECLCDPELRGHILPHRFAALCLELFALRLGQWR